MKLENVRYAYVNLRKWPSPINNARNMKKEFLLNTIPQSSNIDFIIPRDEYFPGMKVVNVIACSCICWKWDDTTGNLKCKLTTRTLSPHEIDRKLTLNMKIVCENESEFPIVLRALITKEFVNLKP